MKESENRGFSITRRRAAIAVVSTAGVTGFIEVLTRGTEMVIAYASPPPITGEIAGSYKPQSSAEYKAEVIDQKLKPLRK